MAEFVLNIVTPHDYFEPISCDYVRVTVCDDIKGKGGGSYGISSCRSKALFSLDSGTIKAYRSGELIFEAQSGPGFASIEDNKVIAVVEECEKTEI